MSTSLKCLLILTLVLAIFSLSYPEKVFDRHGEAKHTRDTKFNLNSIRTSMLTQRSNKNRFDRGRLQAHLSLEKMRQDVQSI